MGLAGFAASDPVVTPFSLAGLAGRSPSPRIWQALAGKYPELVASLISVEGYFTLKDAFWSASVARMNQAEAVAMLDMLRIDPEGWLAGSGVSPTEECIGVARRWLNLQPASTLRAMGSSIVATTGAPSYEALLRSVFVRMPVHLIAEKRSGEGWDVPAWARDEAASFDVVQEVGHMMMLEDGDGFGRQQASSVSKGMIATPAENPRARFCNNIRIEGKQIKHSMGPISIKLYDKFGRILRIETTVNDVSFFKHYREVEQRNGTKEMKFTNMRQTIYSLPALRELLLEIIPHLETVDANRSRFLGCSLRWPLRA